MIVTNCLEEYFLLMETRPELFTPSTAYPIVTDRKIIEDFESQSGKKIGVVYKSPFNTFLVDLIQGEEGLYTYDRVIPTAKNRAVVCVPLYEGKLLLIDQQRHPIRGGQLCFPRGFGEDDFLPMDNAKKELFEEVGATALDCQWLGAITPDSGLIGAECDVFLCTIDGYQQDKKEEGVKAIVLLSEEALTEKIKKREITDSFTLSAYTLYKTR